MEIDQLKKELNLNNSDIAGLFDMKPIVYANSTAKKRYEKALCRFYEILKERWQKRKDAPEESATEP